MKEGRDREKEKKEYIGDTHRERWRRGGQRSEILLN